VAAPFLVPKFASVTQSGTMGIIQQQYRLKQMSNSIRVIDTICQRIETGPTCIGKDHCGLFIRGDDCFRYAMHLESILTKREDRVDKLSIMALQGLLEHLQSTNETTHERIPGLKQMTDEQLVKEVDDRKLLLAQMVGNLCPAILADEITILELEIGNRTESAELN